MLFIAGVRCKGKMRKKIFYICVIVVIFMMSSCEKNTQKNVKSHELDYCKTEQIQLINGMNTKYWKNETDKFINKIQSKINESVFADTDSNMVVDKIEVSPNDIYSPILNKFGAFCADARQKDSYDIEGTVYTYYHLYKQILYYSYYDIDKNGVPELLLSMGSNENIESIVDIYAFNGSEAVCIQGNDSLGDRSHLTIYTNGIIYREDSSGASDGEVTFYRFASNGYELEELNKYTYDSNKMPTPYFNSIESLTDNEFYALFNDYEVISDIEWQKLEVKEIIDYDKLYEAFTSTIGTENEIYFCQDDYDCDGQEEAFGITGVEAYDSLENVRIYYITNDAVVSCIDEISIMNGYGNSYFQYSDIEDYIFINTENARFLSLGGIDGQVIWLYGVKDGSAYQPAVSGQFCEFSKAENNSDEYCAYEFNDASQPEYYIYDKSIKEFIAISQ